jgi:hypothetical protein
LCFLVILSEVSSLLGFDLLLLLLLLRVVSRCGQGKPVIEWMWWTGWLVGWSREMDGPMDGCNSVLRMECVECTLHGR